MDQHMRLEVSSGDRRIGAKVALKALLAFVRLVMYLVAVSIGEGLPATFTL